MPKKCLLFLTLCFAFLHADYYMATTSPYKKTKIRSETSGLVIFSDQSLEYRYVEKKHPIIKIETKQEMITKNALQEQLSLQKSLLTIKTKNYESKAKIKQLSQYDKNLEKMGIIELKLSIHNTQTELKQLNYQLSKKSFFVKECYVDTLYVQKGELISQGEKLYDLYDVSQTKITLFIRHDEIEGIKNKTIYINDAPSTYTIEKISKLRDTQNVSTYQVEIVKPNLSKDISFGKIVKVEFK